MSRKPPRFDDDQLRFLGGVLGEDAVRTLIAETTEPLSAPQLGALRELARGEELTAATPRVACDGVRLYFEYNRSEAGRLLAWVEATERAAGVPGNLVEQPAAPNGRFVVSDEMVHRVYAELAGQGGWMRSGALAQRTGVAQSSVLAALKRLAAEGRVSSTGRSSGTRWRAGGKPTGEVPDAAPVHGGDPYTARVGADSKDRCHDFLAKQKRPVTIGEIAKAMGRSRSLAHAAVSIMQREGRVIVHDDEQAHTYELVR